MSFGLKKKMRNKIIWWKGKEKSYRERAEGKTGAPRSKTSMFSPILSRAQNSLSSFHCSQQIQLKYISKGLPRPLPAASHTSPSSSSICLSFCFETLLLCCSPLCWFLPFATCMKFLPLYSCCVEEQWLLTLYCLTEKLSNRRVHLDFQPSLSVH